MNKIMKIFSFRPTHIVTIKSSGRRVKVRLIRRDNYDNLVESRFPNWLGGVNGWITESRYGYSVEEIQ